MTLDDYQTPPGYGDTVGRCLTYAEIEALLAAERERCAAVADRKSRDASFYQEPLGKAIAIAIRSLPSRELGSQP